MKRWRKITNSLTLIELKKEVKAVLDTFDPISIEEMDRVKLMDRTDMKFNFNINRLPDLLRAVRDQYRALEVAGTRMSRYETLYYDTPGFDLFLKHHNGRTNRYKIRLRRYVESDLNFFEVKFKNNKGRTLKNRVKKKELDTTITGNSEDFFSKMTGMSPGEVEPKLWVNYNRVTLVNRFEEERLTIDLDLEVKSESGCISFEKLVIVEAKQAKPTETAFVKLLKKAHIREGGTSKYCIAVANLVHDVKKNNFKSALNEIEKIINETPPD
ncbi:MAG: polyphosphate polymerase domain-containing protein [Bacteroidetes bacterium]|nr:polyphosphate polymerase domain-containing protein [Bacteroidota bacterium]